MNNINSVFFGLFFISGFAIFGAHLSRGFGAALAMGCGSAVLGVVMAGIARDAMFPFGFGPLFSSAAGFLLGPVFWLTLIGSVELIRSLIGLVRRSIRSNNELKLPRHPGA